MNWKNNKSFCLVVLVIALVVVSSHPAFGLGRKGRGDSFMRAFGMTVKGDNFVASYGTWSSQLAADAGVGEVGPVTAQYREGFDDIIEVQHRITLGMNNILNISNLQVWYSFLPYPRYRGGYRSGGYR